MLLLQTRISQRVNERNQLAEVVDVRLQVLRHLLRIKAAARVILFATLRVFRTSSTFRFLLELLLQLRQVSAPLCYGILHLLRVD